MEEFFHKTMQEYISNLQKHGINLKFKIEISINGHFFTYTQPNTTNSFTYRLILRWGGRKIGNYYWEGSLSSHQQTVNQLLLDNLVTKLQMHGQTRYSLECGMRILNSAVKAIEAKDVYTKGHSDRVALLALTIAERLEPDCSEYDIEIASKLHDIGKIGISEQILCKPGKLCESEIKEIRRHPEIGAEILEPLPIFEHLVPAIRHHHERYDGKGYPDKLAGTDIPLLSRIIAVADTFDAITSDRPYRKAMTLDSAFKEIDSVKGTQLDPYITQIFLSIPPEQLLPVIAR